MLSLFLLASLAFAGPLERIADKYCGSEISSSWERDSKFLTDEVYTETSLYKIVVEPEEIHYWISNGRVIGVGAILESGKPENHLYYKSQKVWKILNRKYGEPITTDYAWVWETSDFKAGLGQTPFGMVFYLECLCVGVCGVRD